MWFFSGIVMMYVPFPSVSDEERLTYMSPIDTKALSTTPASAVADCGEAEITGLRLIVQRASCIHLPSGAETRLCMQMTGPFSRHEAVRRLCVGKPTKP